MKTFTFTKKILFSLIIAIAVIFCNCFTLIPSKMKSANASTTTINYQINANKITNGDFSSSSSNGEGKPKTINQGWTATSSAPSTITSGIIDVAESNFNLEKVAKYGLESNPGISNDINQSFDSSGKDIRDKNILMIKSTSNTQFGYTSDKITLESSKYYMLSVRCKTGIDSNYPDSFASIYTNLADLAFTEIHTFGQWKTYTFLIATDTFNSSSITLELRLGNKNEASNGVVFFDYITLDEVSNLDYFSATEDTVTKKLDLDTDYDVANNFDNYNFEDGENGWVKNENNNSLNTVAVRSYSSINADVNNLENTTNKNYANSFYANSNNALFFASTNTDASKISSTSTNFLNIAQHSFYKLSVLIKTSQNGKLTISLNDLDEAVEPINQSNLTSGEGSASINGFKQIDFFIRGNVKKSSKVGIEFTFTGEGWAIVDEIKLQKVNQKECSSTNQFDLASVTANTKTILNGNFDFVANTTSNVVYPAAPLNWSTLNDLSGIIRIRKEYFDADCEQFGLHSAQNPGPCTSYPGLPQGLIAETSFENALMVRTINNTDTYVTSEIISLSKNTNNENIYKIMVSVKTLDTAKAFIKLVDKDDNVLAFYDNISASNWTNYTLYINNGITAQDVYLRLGTYGNGNNNYAFFDYVDYSTETSVNISNIIAQENTMYIDLLNDSFYSHTTTKNNDLYKTINYSNYKSEEGKEAALYNGIISINDNPALKTRTSANDKNIFVISNDVEGYQIIKTNYTYTLSANNYYKFNIWMKTELTNAQEDNAGALFEVVSLDKDGNIVVDNDNKNKFANIVTGEAEENNGWVSYSIYIYTKDATDEQSFKVLLGLGETNKLASGRVYFDDLSVKSIDATEYANAKANSTTIVSTALPAATTNNNSEETTPSSNEASNINIWALFSSIILIIALAFAIAGYLIRRIPKRKIAKIQKSEYNVKPTAVDANLVKRELKETREKKLAEIEKEIETLTQQRDEEQKQYEEKTNNEENLTEKQKLYTFYTKRINKLNKQIDYLSSAVTYMKDETNIKLEEIREIKRRTKENEKEFFKLKTAELEQISQEEKSANKKNS